MPIPVAPVVVKVIAGEIGVFAHKVGLLEEVETVFRSFTVIVPTALIFPQPPVRGIE